MLCWRFWMFETALIDSSKTERVDEGPMPNPDEKPSETKEKAFGMYANA